MAKPLFDISVLLFQPDTLHIAILFTPECLKPVLPWTCTNPRPIQRTARLCLRSCELSSWGSQLVALWEILPRRIFWKSRSCLDNDWFNAIHTHWKRQLEQIIRSEDVMTVGKDGTAWHWRGMACKTKGPFSRCVNAWVNTSTAVRLPDC